MAAETLPETPNSIDTLLECLRILRKVEHELETWRPVIETWRPVIERFRTPAAAMLASRAARKGGRQ